MTDSSIPLSELKPYDVHQLQSEFHCYSPCEAYVHLCQRMGCRPSQAVTALLPTMVGAWDKVEVIDLSRTYVGPKGVIPVVELCKRLPRLRRLSVAGNYLQNDSAWFVAQLAMYHPSLAKIDVSDNEFLSWSGATCLGTAVAQNPRLTFVNLQRTAVEPATAEAIFLHTRRNAAAMALAQGHDAPRPVNHPAAIHLRSMRRLFDRLKDPSTGVADRDVLEKGYIEHMHMLGSSNELEHCNEAFFTQLKDRAPSDKVSWDVFVVLVLLDAPSVDGAMIATLRTVFAEFNINVMAGAAASTAVPAAAVRVVSSGNSGDEVQEAVLLEGFVEAKAFEAVYVRLLSTTPTLREVAALQSGMGLDAEHHTVTWDEFLYIWYNKGPVVGERLFVTNATNMPRRIRPLHS